MSFETRCASLCVTYISHLCTVQKFEVLPDQVAQSVQLKKLVEMFLIPKGETTEAVFWGKRKPGTMASWS